MTEPDSCGSDHTRTDEAQAHAELLERMKLWGLERAWLSLRGGEVHDGREATREDRDR